MRLRRLGGTPRPRLALAGAGSRPSPFGDLARTASVTATIAALGVLAAAVAVTLPTPSPLIAAAVVVGLALPLWMALTKRQGLALVILMLYLALVDGVVKLATGSSVATLGRDVLLYAIVIGALVRLLVQSKPIELPPWSAWVLAFVAVTLVQIANPESHGLGHSLAALRQHLEFVPLFFLGYALIRSEDRLRLFVILLLAVTLVNGVASYIQLGLTPDQIASWGPGYAERVSGSGVVSSRIAFDAAGNAYGVRPFALGSDSGFGGILGMIAVPAALGLLATARRPGSLALVGVLALGAALAVATSQARVAVVGSIVAGFAFLALTVSSRRALSTLLAAGVAAIIALVVVSAVRGATGGDAFQRLEGIAPDEIVTTAFDYRSDTFSKLPEYVSEIPLGAGLGTTGPAAGALGVEAEAFESESQPSFLLIELGLLGAIVFLAFNVRVLTLSVRRIRRMNDPRTRALLAALAASLFAIFVTGFVGSTSAATPSAPFYWFAIGVLAYWIGSDRFAASAFAAPADPGPESSELPRAGSGGTGASPDDEERRFRIALERLRREAERSEARARAAERRAEQAERVLRYRREGRLKTVEDLDRMPGLPAAMRAELRRKLTE